MELVLGVGREPVALLQGGEVLVEPRRVEQRVVQVQDEDQLPLPLEGRHVGRDRNARRRSVVDVRDRDSGGASSRVLLGRPAPVAETQDELRVRGAARGVVVVATVVAFFVHHPVPNGGPGSISFRVLLLHAARFVVVAVGVSSLLHRLVTNGDSGRTSFRVLLLRPAQEAEPADEPRMRGAARDVVAVSSLLLLHLAYGGGGGILPASGGWVEEVVGEPWQNEIGAGWGGRAACLPWFCTTWEFLVTAVAWKRGTVEAQLKEAHRPTNYGPF